MARGSDTARDTATFGLQTGRGAFGTVMPALERNIAAPVGYSEQDLARANTAAQQSAGGAAASAVGQGGLLAARTRNPGAAQYAIGQGVRDAADAGTEAALGIKLKDADLKEQKRASALSQLGQIGESGLGTVAPAVNADSQAKEASWGWAKNILQPILSAASKSSTLGFGG